MVLLLFLCGVAVVVGYLHSYMLPQVVRLILEDSRWALSPVLAWMQKDTVKSWVRPMTVDCTMATQKEKYT